MINRALHFLLLAAMPLLLPAQTNTTMTANGSWNDSGNWSAGIPTTNAYNAILGADRTINDMTTDVIVTDFTTSGSASFTNFSNKTLTVEGAFTHTSGTLTIGTSLGIWLKGTTTISSSVVLQNGSGVRNDGTLNITSSGGLENQAPAPAARFSGYNFLNAGTTNLTSASNVSLQNFTVLNTGTMNVSLTSGNAFNAQTYTQTAGTTKVAAGSTLSVNNLNLTAGTVFGTGTYNGSSTTFGNGTSGATISAGDTLNTAGKLTFTGNMNTIGGSTFRFDLGGTSQGINHDWLVLPGGNFNNVILEFNLINGYTPTNGDNYTVVTGNNFSGVFGNMSAGKVTMSGVGTFDVTISNTSVVLGNFAAIPEPATCAAAVGLGALGLVLLRRRRAGA